MTPVRSISAQAFAQATNMPLPEVYRLIRARRLPAWRDRETWTWRIPLPLRLADIRPVCRISPIYR